MSGSSTCRPNAAGVVALLTGMVGPLNLLVLPLMDRAGAFSHDGDLIVGADARRIRSRKDLDDELARLKPGDTMYLTVIRPLPGGAHKTMEGRGHGRRVHRDFIAAAAGRPDGRGAVSLLIEGRPR
jgi:hypothetical protein